MESAWPLPDGRASLGSPLPPLPGRTAAHTARQEAAGTEDTARGTGLLNHIRTSLGLRGGAQAEQALGQPDQQQPEQTQRSRGFTLRRMTSKLPAALSSLGSTGSADSSGGGAGCEAAPFARTSHGCQLHIQCSFSAFTPEEVEAAGAAAARPGIVTLLRRWIDQPKCPVASWAFHGLAWAGCRATGRFLPLLLTCCLQYHLF